jgi:hypothetical protein
VGSGRCHCAGPGRGEGDGELLGVTAGATGRGDTPTAEHQRDQRATRPPVPVGEGVDGLELKLRVLDHERESTRLRLLAAGTYVLAYLGGVLKLVTSGGIAGSSAELGPT